MQTKIPYTPGALHPSTVEYLHGYSPQGKADAEWAYYGPIWVARQKLRRAIRRVRREAAYPISGAWMYREIIRGEIGTLYEHYREEVAREQAKQ